MKDKILVISVTRDNPVLLQHMFQTFKRYDPGYPCDFLLVDNDSQTDQQKRALTWLDKDGIDIVQATNDRVEASFDWAWRKNKGYKYYFFTHDDAAANKHDWLKVFVDRMNSNYVEEIIKGTSLEKLPIGKVGAQTQFWRSYSSVLGYSVQCLFLEQVLKVMGKKIPPIFKYSDCDRVLISSNCLKATNGIRSLKDFKNLEKTNPELFSILCGVLDYYLRYPDEGMPPRDQYPPGKHWNKFCLTAEMMNSIDPLVNDYRTVGLEGDGFLEEIHGYDDLWGQNFIHHYGAPNFREHMAKIFQTDKEEVKKHFNEKVFLLKMDKIVQDYFK